MKENKLSKEKLVGFIKKFHVNGLFQNAYVTAENGRLETGIMSEDKGIRGHIILKDFPMPDAEFGCFDPAKLLKSLNYLGKDIEIVPRTKKYLTHSLVFVDAQKKRKIDYGTVTKDLINHDGKKCVVKTYEVKIPLSKSCIQDFLDAYKTMEADITFIKRNGKLFAGCSNDICCDDTAIFELTYEKLDSNFDQMEVRGEWLKKILEVNKVGYTYGYIELSNKGVAKVSFEDEDCSAEYWLVRLQWSSRHYKGESG